jgi:hypothetical protein
VLDPRLAGQLTDRDAAELEDISLRTRADIDQLHKAVNQMRETRVRLETIKKWSGGDAAAKPVLDAANSLMNKVAPIEARLVQVKMAASEDNLRYPNMLNEQYDSFAATLDGEDFGPTDAQRQVFAYLHGELAAQLELWRSIAATDLPALQSLMHAHGIPSMDEVQGL